MVAWMDFAASDPQLAGVGERLLFQHGIGLAYIATIGEDGSPRLHPLSPVLSNGRLFVFILPTSPKKRDLLRDGKFALQTFPPPGLDFLKQGEEFYVTGKAELVTDPRVRACVITDAKQHVGDDEALFELKIRRVMHSQWATGKTGGLQPVRRKWIAPAYQQ